MNNNRPQPNRAPNNPSQGRPPQGSPPQSRPPQNRQPQGQTGTGGFKVSIDERDLMTGSLDMKHRAQPGQYSEPPSARNAAMTPKELRAEKRAHKKRNRVKARKNKRVFSIVWLCMVLLLSFTFASYLIGGSNDFFGANRRPGKVDVTIPEGKLTEEVLADVVFQAGLIEKPEFFWLYCKVRADMEDYAPGIRYQIDTDLDYEALLNQLMGGNDDLEVVQVVFPEGSTALQMANLLEENEVCTAEAFLNELNNGDYSKYEEVSTLDGTGRYYKLEGYLFPDTYDFYKGEELDSVVGKLLNNFHQKVDSKLREKIDESGMTLDEVVILASIIQAEAANTTDMFDVSAVLHNRMNFGADYGIMNLECDSTSFYPYKNAKEMEELGNTLSHGNYDTYTFSGLPAGAICNPGLDAINAALRPNSTGDAASYLYFCHSDEGVAYYATNAEDHEYNKQLAGLS